MKRLSIALAVGLLSVLATGCIHNYGPEEVYYYNLCTLYQKFDPIPNEGYPFFFVSDDTTVLYPNNYKDLVKHGLKAKDEDRFMVYFRKLESNSTKAKLNDYGEIIDAIQVDHILKLEPVYSSQVDTFANDVVRLKSIWLSGGPFDTRRYVNIHFSYYGTGLRRHYFYAVVNPEYKNPDEKGIFHLMLRHNRKGDRNDYPYSSLLSIAITDDMLSQKVQGVEIMINNEESGTTEVKTLMLYK